MTPERTRAWRALAGLAADLVRAPLAPLAAEPDRFERYSSEGAGLLLDLSRQRLNQAVLRELLALAEEQNLADRTDALFSGAHVNTTEDRAALHTALRAPASERPPAAADVADTARRVARLVDDIRDARWRGCSGASITDVVHIGIGGSHLGPELVVEALRHPSHRGPRIRFAANVDGEALGSALRGIDPTRTLFVVASKSFTTLETRINAESARSWFLERVNDRGALSRHFVALSSNVPAAEAFGIAPENVFPLWDWVGGRYSLWSAVGMTVALAIGNAEFAELLAGAHAMDRHFREAPPERNLPILAALVGIWNSNFLGATNHAVLPYSERLRLLPDYLQQLEMESNGKSVHAGGTPVGIHTAPILWGGRGTNGQHAFHQLLHQGTRAFSVDFVLATAAGRDFAEHQRWLLANALAQGQAMFAGNDDADPHRRVPGGHGSSTLILPRITPAALGALLAMYEHKVFCQGAIWDINSFDQWGVELGKRLAIPIYEQLGGGSTLAQDAPTRGLIERLRGD